MSPQERALHQADAELSRRRIAHLKTWMASGRLSPAAWMMAEAELSDEEHNLRAIEGGLAAHAGLDTARVQDRFRY